MGRRFEYLRISSGDFADKLDALDMSYLTFSRLTGEDSRKVRKILSGDRDVPTWYAMVLHVWTAVTPALVESRQWAAESIRLDNLRPQDGEFPYLDTEAAE